MPYLEVNQGNQEEIEAKEEITIPNITGITIQEAEKILTENGLNLKINDEPEQLDKANTIVQGQTPQPGIVIFKENDIFVEI